MKSSKKVLIIGLLTACFAMCGHVQAATAPQGWSFCEIDYIGPLFGKTVMALTSTEGKWVGNVWVILDSATEKPMLATALTARSLDAVVKCWIMGDSVNVAGMPMQTLYGVGIVPEGVGVPAQ